MGMHNGLIGQANGGASCNQSGTPRETNDLTLGDYYARKQREEAFDTVAIETKQTQLERLFKEALSWGRVYGELVSLDWDTMRDTMAKQFATTFMENSK